MSTGNIMNRNTTELLDDLYNNIKNPTSFSSFNVLLDYLKNKNSLISDEDLKNS